MTLGIAAIAISHAHTAAWTSVRSCERYQGREGGRVWTQRPVLAGSGMAPFETERMESCRSPGMVPAGLFRPWDPAELRPAETWPLKATTVENPKAEIDRQH
jgi:hypothetical protein